MNNSATETHEPTPSTTQRLPYVAPRVVKKRSVARATLFTGGSGVVGAPVP